VPGFTKYDKILISLFVLTLPLINPWVRGDGVGYYAFARSLLIEHRLDFTQDWLRANASFRMGRVDGKAASGLKRGRRRESWTIIFRLARRSCGPRF
jgi:hypothetical protein